MINQVEEKKKKKMKCIFKIRQNESAPLMEAAVEPAPPW